MNTIKIMLGPMRVLFLILVPVCVALGVGTAYWQTRQISWMDVLLVFIGALASHICVNVFNEYFDFKSGLDLKTKRTPFSGGSGTLPENPELERIALGLAVLSLIVTMIIGAYFVWLRGWLLLPLGMLGLMLVVTYTIWWTRNSILCLIAPGLGFGLLMVMGTHFALTGSYSWVSFVASLVPTFLVSDLLLLNQFPDVAADKSSGRSNFPITIGRRASVGVYGVFMLAAYLTMVAAAIAGLLPLFTLIALITAIPAWKAYRGARRNAENIPGLIPSMGRNVLVNLATPALMAVGLFLSWHPYH